MQPVSIVAPALTMRDVAGRVDRVATTAYAQRARESWLDAFLVCGSLGLGPTLSVRSRREVLALWLDQVPAERVLGCAWNIAEVNQIRDAGARPVAVVRDAHDEDAVLRLLDQLPTNAFVYSHPQYTPAVLSPAVVEKARALGTLPAGAKVSKVGLEDVRALRDAAGSSFELYDGRCRHLRASVEAGATGVVAVPLSSLPHDLPPRDDLDALQAVIDRGQRVVDAHADVAGQAVALRAALDL